MSNQNCCPETNATAGCFKEAVCIDTKRIYDSCGDKECIDGLQVFFFGNDQEKINSAMMVKAKKVEIIHTYIEVESVPFDKGFYSVDITYFFKVTIAVHCTPGCAPCLVEGLATYSKKVILYGSEGNVRTYSSEFPNASGSNMPHATVQVVDPLILACKLEECVTSNVCPVLPCCVTDCFCGNICHPQSGHKIVTVTLGIFSIVQLDRRVQLLIPAYDFCLPCKDCSTNTNPDDPCELFAKIKFPTDEFFPPKQFREGDC